MSEKPEYQSRASGPSRRDFLSRSAKLAAGAGVLGAIAADDVFAAFDAELERSPLGQPLEPTALGSSQTARIGIIGTGGMGTEHARAFNRLAASGREDVQVVALCDVSQHKLEAAQRRCLQDRPEVAVALYTDYRAMLADRSLHGILIASPEHWHAKMAEDAIMSGKDVYIEKPMTLKLGEALRLLRLLRKYPYMQAVVGTQYVMHPSYHAARQLIADGTIGTPVSSQTSYCRNSKNGEWLYYAINREWQPGVNLDWREWCGPLGRHPWDPEVYARWRRYRTWSTGIIGDLLVHRITPLIQALDAGWPTRVVAVGGHLVDKAMENHDQVNLSIEFENGHVMYVAGSTANEVGMETMIRGHKANLYLGGRNLTMRPERIWADEIDELTVEGPNIRDTQQELRYHWLNTMRSREPVQSDVELGTKVMVAVDLATRSLWEGKAYSFDPNRLRDRAI